MKIIMMLFFISMPIFANETVCLINTHYPRIVVNDETIIDNGGMFNSCDQMDCLIESAKSLMSIGQCDRIEMGREIEVSNRDCVIHSHYPRIVRDDRTLYDGGGFGDKFDDTIKLIELSKMMKDIGVCSSIRVE